MKLLAIATMTLMSMSCASTTKLYRITPVLTMADSLKCAQAGGHAGMISDLDNEGVPKQNWVAGCVLAVK